jgi:hypothetical protein
VAAALIGFLLGNGGGDSEETGEPFGNSASAGTVELSFPDAWSRVSEQPAIPGVRFRDPIVLAVDTPRGARLAAGQVAATGPELLSAGLKRRLPGSAPAGETVRLGDLQALRYGQLEPRGLDGPLQLYAVPTTAGVATIACTGPAGTAGEAFRTDCESVATTLQLTGAEAYTLGPQPAYARALRRTLDGLNRQVSSGTARLRQAGSPEEQAAAAAALAGDYRRAAEAVAVLEVSPRDAAANRGLAAAPERTGSAYAAAADAARANDEAAYSAAERRVRRSQSELRSALSEFEQLGYALS